jgi:hypothetical protein
MAFGVTLNLLCKHVIEQNVTTFCPGVKVFYLLHH